MDKVALITVALVALVAVGGLASLNLGSPSAAASIDQAADFGYAQGVKCSESGINARGCCSQMCNSVDPAACERMCLLRVSELRQ